MYEAMLFVDFFNKKSILHSNIEIKPQNHIQV